jgi:hypothetical protein
MAMHELPSLRWTIPIGAIIALIGLFFMVVSLGAAPQGYATLPSPGWIVFCAGLIFLLCGGVIALRGAAGTLKPDGDLAPDAPRWLRLAQYLAGLAVFACFGAIATWIAFGPGPRTFSASGPFLPSQPSELLGRTVFGVGAVLTWLGMIALAVNGALKLFGRNKS